MRNPRPDDAIGRCPHHSAVGGETDRPTHDARELTDGGTQAWIRLDDKLYALKITRAGKLILTK